MRGVVVSGFKSLRTMNLTSNTKNVGEGRTYVRRRGIGSIIGSRFVFNARRTCMYIRSNSTSNSTSFNNKCPIFDKKNGGNLFVDLIFCANY